MRDVDSPFKQVFYHFIAILLDGVVDRGLSVGVNCVELCARVYELLRGLDVALPDAVEDGRLSVGVQMVYVRSVFQKELNYLVVAFAHCVVERNLVQLVLSFGVHPLVQEEFDEPKRLFLVLDRASIEEGRLVKVDHIVFQICHIDTVRLHIVYNFVDVPFLQALEKLTSKLRARCQCFAALGRMRLSRYGRLLKLAFLRALLL